MENKTEYLKKIIHENLRHNSFPRSIDDLISNVGNINYRPYYKRNHVWDNIKETFFIESVLMNAEIPPLIWFLHKDKRELIDGSQRYKTLLKFKNNEIKLDPRGLTKLKHLSGKKFESLEETYRNVFLKIQVRIYEYELHNNIPYDKNDEIRVKQEIFERYNSGVTPLTQLEIFKAQYINDAINYYFRKPLEDNPSLLDIFITLFGIKPVNMQKVLKKIRQLLVLHLMPIRSSSYNKNKLIIHYNQFSILTTESQGWNNVYEDFLRKVIYIHEIQKGLGGNYTPSINFYFEAIYWALSVCYQENIAFENIQSPTFKKKLIAYLQKNQKLAADSPAYYGVARYNERFSAISLFFSNQFNIDFDPYIYPSKESIQNYQELLKTNIKKESSIIIGIKGFLKKDPLSTTINTIVNEIKSNNYCIRPDYQRGDVISRKKSSAIIESILLGIQIPPIFSFKRKNGRSEIVDGQQRILSILAFLGISYTDEKKIAVKSKNDKFKLFLKDNTILKEYNNYKFDNLPEDMQKKIRNTSIEIIEINEENNPGFDPVDLFMRLNFKPYPIKENTFESWNSSVERRITDRIKAIYQDSNSWFYCSKKNFRMENEDLITCLIYLQYKSNQLGNEFTFDFYKQHIPIYMLDKRLHIRFCNKNDITRTLQTSNLTDQILIACDQFETDFLGKVKLLLSSSTPFEMSNELDEILFSKTEGKSRTNLRLYILWILLSRITQPTIKQASKNVKLDITHLFNKISKVKNPMQFESLTTDIWNKYESFNPLVKS